MRRNTSFEAAEPCAGNTYIIRRVGTNSLITLKHGALVAEQVQAHAQADNHRWECITRDGHFGLRNAASGTFIGHQGLAKMHALVAHHRLFEYLDFKHVADRGFLLLAEHWWQVSQPVAIDADGRTLVRGWDYDCLWEFALAD